MLSFASFCRLTGLAAAILIGLSPTVVDAADLDRQRALFRQLFPAVERGNWQVVEDLSPRDQQLLQSYVLWPDLRATWLKANISDVPRSELQAFLKAHPGLKPARDVRYRYALDRVRKGDLAGYLQIYEQYYQGQDVPKLDCLALQAEIAAGRKQRVVYRATELWMIGKSQVKECDPVFEFLKDERLLGVLEYRKRFELAIDAREFSLARWLAKRIDSQHVDIATDWMTAAAQPEDFLRKPRNSADNAILRDQLVYAVERLTYRDPVVADALWRDVRRRFRFSEKQILLTAQHIALWMARDNLEGAYSALTRLPLAAQNDEVLRWRARVSLRSADWPALLRDIASMSDAEKGSEEWRYWRAIGLQKAKREAEAAALLQALSTERSYYGFLAADALGKPYALTDDELAADESIIAAIAARPEVVRARELFYVGQDSRGRSEWSGIMRYLDAQEKIQAAILAHRWGWHSRAIATAASLGEYDDLKLRYPLPFKSTFVRSSSDARIAATWAYGIARSESLFMRDVRSHAGAVGLMQLMPATGREVAREIALPYSGLATLTNASDNIRLGTTYLGMMAERYGGHRVPATAAYNAGPHRVDRWLPEEGTIDARIWIENIPFNETRKYVRRVLAAQTIFHWRMTGKTQRLTAALGNIEARNEQLAAR